MFLFSIKLNDNDQIVISVRGGKYSHITQIAASVIGREKEFSTYVYPKLPISARAEKATGIILHNSGTMTVPSQEVHAEKLTVAIKEFCRWLKQHLGVFLIAHNGRKFNYPHFDISINKYQI